MDEAVPLRDRVVFFAGVLFALAGGFGVALGSWLHDLLRVPFVGRNYASFGPVNWTWFAVGVVLLVVGAVLLYLGLRGGVRSEGVAGWSRV